MPFLTECVMIAVKCMIGFFVIACIFGFFGLLGNGIWVLITGCHEFNTTWAKGNLEQRSFTEKKK